MNIIELHVCVAFSSTAIKNITKNYFFLNHEAFNLSKVFDFCVIISIYLVLVIKLFYIIIITFALLITMMFIYSYKSIYTKIGFRRDLAKKG